MKICTLYAADPDSVSGVARDLELLGLTTESATLTDGPPGSRVDLVCVSTGNDAAGALSFCQVLGKEETMRSVPLLLLVRLEHLRELFLREGAFDDFLVIPYQLAELDARLRHLLWRSSQGQQTDVLTFGPLTVNLATYQVHVEGRPVNLTYMEYELLKFLATHRARVFTRQALLSRVWGYDYFGGTRTVDVHVRRLRSKLGEHANVIQTVRNVGYKFAG
ncbi:MAG TPA: response regulator transcription factor [Actinomycetota bacterium]|nr:response regulator transcription factor [Actinomycetota bacterium]